MIKLRFAAIAAASASLALSPAPVSAQAAATPKVSMGVQLQGHAEGAQVAAVRPAGTAAAMGLKVGDIVMELDGKPISPEVAQEHSQRTKVGDPITIKVKRDGAIVELTGKALAAPAPAAQPQ
jgi:S1-C subfamily serine protease